MNKKTQVLDDYLQIRLTKELKDKLKKLAEKNERSVSYTALMILREALAQ